MSTINENIVSKIRNLEAGTTFKNFKELCCYLNISYMTGGNQKAAFMDDIRQYAQLEKKGNSIIFKQIYDEINPKYDGRAEGNHKVYQGCLESLILQLLIYKPRTLYRTSFNRLCMQWNVFTKKTQATIFNEVKEKWREKSNYEIRKKQFDAYFREIEKRIILREKSLIKSCLDSMASKGIIYWWQDIYLVTPNRSRISIEGDSEKQTLYDNAINYAVNKLEMTEAIANACNKQDAFYSKVNEYLSHNTNGQYTHALKLITVKSNDLTKSNLYENYINPKTKKKYGKDNAEMIQQVTSTTRELQEKLLRMINKGFDTFEGQQRAIAKTRDSYWDLWLECMSHLIENGYGEKIDKAHEEGNDFVEFAIYHNDAIIKDRELQEKIKEYFKSLKKMLFPNPDDLSFTEIRSMISDIASSILCLDQ